MITDPSRPRAEFDFRDLLRHPEKLFGYGYLYLFAALLFLGALYAGNLSTIGRRSIQPLVPRDSSGFQTDIPFRSASVLPPVDVRVAGTPSDSLLALGAALYKANCSSCHGDNGEGDGPAGGLLNPRPRNFHSLSGWTNGSKVAQIYRTLQEGIVRNGMASYSYLPPADRFALAHYVRSFAQGQPQDTPEDLQALETQYQLSRGSSTPGQIPVKRAASLILSEGEARRKRLEELVRTSATDPEPGAALFRRLASRPAAVLDRYRLGRPTDLSAFIGAVEKDPLTAGFRAAVVHLNSNEWALLHGYVTGARGKEGR